MKTAEFLKTVDRDKVVQAIVQAESNTSGEIRVFVSRKPAPTPVTEATKQFARMGMDKTKERNGVLIFVSPPSNTFAILGDNAIHDKCGQDFWVSLTEEMSKCFKAGDFTSAIVAGVQRAGAILSRHFPRQPHDINELSDQVESE